LTRVDVGVDDEVVERVMTVFVSPAAALLTHPACPVSRGKNTELRRHQQDMNLPKSQTAPGCSSGPPIDVQAWRRCRLLEAGFAATLADAVAADSRFDLHALLQLVDRGCPAELAVRILGPLPREVAPWTP
jgi:hypothetical protein